MLSSWTPQNRQVSAIAARTRRQLAGVVSQAHDEHVRPLPLAVDCQLRENGADLAVLAGAADPELAGLVVRRVQDELLGACIILGLHSAQRLNTPRSRKAELTSEAPARILRSQGLGSHSLNMACSEPLTYHEHATQWCEGDRSERTVVSMPMTLEPCPSSVMPKQPGVASVSRPWKYLRWCFSVPSFAMVPAPRQPTLRASRMCSAEHQMLAGSQPWAHEAALGADQFAKVRGSSRDCWQV